MKDQLQTVRVALEKMGETRWPATLQAALTALTQLEAMVGEQKPVAYAIFAENGNIRLWSTEPQHVKRIAQEKGLSLVPLYAAPVAQPQEPDLTSLLFAVEQAAKNGHCPWEIEAAFDEYEAARKAAPVAQQAEAVPPSNLIDPGSVVSFAVDRWLAEVSNRPLVNKNRRTLDDTWRQVILRFGGDPDVLLGPPHDELAAIAQQKGASHE